MLWQRAILPDPAHQPLDPSSFVHAGPRATLAVGGSELPVDEWLVFRAEFDPAGLVDLLVEVAFADGTCTTLRPTVTGRNAFYASFRSKVAVERVTAHVSGTGNLLEPRSISVRPQGAVKQVVPIIRRACRILVRHPDRLLGSAAWFFHRMVETKAVHLPPERPRVLKSQVYPRWIELFDERPDEDRGLHEHRLQALAHQPLVSVLAVPDTRDELEAILQNLSGQIYPHWQLVVAQREGAGQSDLLTDMPGDGRLVPVQNPGDDRAAGLNAALAAAEGAIVTALPQGGELRPHALLEAVLAFAALPQIRLLYADEDVRAADGRRRDPRFKTAWQPHGSVVHDIAGDPTFYSAEALRTAGGWREGLQGAEDHDLKLRIAEAAGPATVAHLAKILLHRKDRASPETAAARTAVKVASDHLGRIGVSARVLPDARSPYPRVIRQWPEKPLVSLIIPTRDRATLLRTCLGSILDRTAYPSFEIIVVDNGSEEPQTHALFRDLEQDGRVRILPQPGPFNYSALNNAAVRDARGPVVALVNNDIEVVAEDWLDEMVGYALDPRVGCVGAKLYYPNGTLQHASVVVGLSGGAGHVHKQAARNARGYLDRLVSVQNVSAVTAACLVVRKAVYEQVGGLDEDLFKVAFNDVDFCLKVASAGYLNVWTPFAELTHHESVSRGNDLMDRAKARRFAGELAALQNRWGTRLYFDPFYSPNLDWQSEDGEIRTS